MEVFGPNELVEEVLKREFCIGCGACVNLCPYFKSYHRKDRHALSVGPVPGSVPYRYQKFAS